MPCCDWSPGEVVEGGRGHGLDAVVAEAEGGQPAQPVEVCVHQARDGVVTQVEAPQLRQSVQGPLACNSRICI